MEWLLAIAVLTAVAPLVVIRVLHRRRLDRPAHRPPGMSVTLSVLPSRTAVVVLGAESDTSSRALDRLVDRAVRDAFVFEAVDVVEVRRRNGEFLYRRHRDHGASRGSADPLRLGPGPREPA